MDSVYDFSKVKEYKTYTALKPVAAVVCKTVQKCTYVGKDNIPKTGGFILACNHQSTFDPIALGGAGVRVVHFMAKEELFKGLHGKIFNKIGLIKVYRGKPNYKAIEEAEKILNNGGTIGIFPEGTRNKTQNNLLEFRKGAVRIAKSTNTPILPFAIKGEYKLFRKSITLEFGNPIDVSKMEIEEGNEYLRNEVLKLYRK